MDDGPVEKEGYLTKQGAIFKNWKKRWFVLRGNTLSYFKNRGDSKPKGVIDLSECKTVKGAEESTNIPFSFEVAVPKRRYFIVAENATEKSDWLRVIARAVVKQSSSANWDDHDVHPDEQGY